MRMMMMIRKMANRMKKMIMMIVGMVRILLKIRN